MARLGSTLDSDQDQRSQWDYDDRFRDIISTPDLQDLDDQGSAMARDYDETTDYSAPRDYSGEQDYSSVSSSRDRYQQNRGGLNAAERDSAKASRPGGRDIGKQERGDWDGKATVIKGRRNLAKYKKEHPDAMMVKGRFKGRGGSNKKFLIGGGVGLFALAVPIFVIGILVSGIAQFFQLDNLLESKLGFISSNIVAARNMANTISMAKQAARQAVTGQNANSITNGKKVGVLVDRVANKTLDNLAAKGVRFSDDGAHMYIDVTGSNGMTRYNSNFSIGPEPDPSNVRAHNEWKNSASRATQNVADDLGINKSALQLSSDGKTFRIDLASANGAARKGIIRQAEKVGVTHGRIISAIRARAVGAKLVATAASTNWWQPIKKLKLLLKEAGSSMNMKLTKYLVAKALGESVDAMIDAVKLKAFKDIVTASDASPEIKDQVKGAKNVAEAKSILSGKELYALSDQADEAATKAATIFRANAAKGVVNSAVDAAKGGIIKRLPKQVVQAMGKVGDVAKAVGKSVSASAFGITTLIVQAMEWACMIAAVDDALGATSYMNTVIPAIGEASSFHGSVAEIRAGFPDYESSEDSGSADCTDGEEEVEDGETLVCQTLSPMDQIGLDAKRTFYNDEITLVCEDYVEYEKDDDDDGKLREGSQEVCGTTTDSGWNSAPIKALMDEDYSDDDINDTVPTQLRTADKGVSYYTERLGIGAFGDLLNGIIKFANAYADSILGKGICAVLTNFFGGLMVSILAGIADGVIAGAGTLGGAVTFGASTGAIIALTAGTIAISLAIGKAVSDFSAFMEGDPLTTDQTTLPSEHVSIMAHGEVWRRNEETIELGGRELTDTEVAELWGEQQRYLAQEWAGRPLLERLFDPNDYRSTANVIARVANFDTSSQDPLTQMANVAKFFGSIPQLFGAAFYRINGVSALQASQPFGGYDFGPIYGYSAAEIEKMSDENYEILNNVNEAGNIIASNDSKKRMIENCWAASIDSTTLDVKQTENFDGTKWNYIDNRVTDGETGKNYNAGCGAVDDDELLRVRFAMLDEGLLTPDDCYTNDGWAGGESADSCEEMGMAVSSGGSSNDNGGGGGSWQDKDWSDASNMSALQSEFANDTDNDNPLGYTKCGTSQCPSVPRWFIAKYTTLEGDKGPNGMKNGLPNEGDSVAKNIAELNGYQVSKTPTAPAIYSVRCPGTGQGDWGATCSNDTVNLGHTGLLLSAENGKYVTLQSGGSDCSYTKDYYSIPSFVEFFNIPRDKLK
jgi:hypothetical protein